MINISAQYMVLRPFLEYIIQEYQRRFILPEGLRLSYGEQPVAPVHIQPGNSVQFFTQNNPRPHRFTWIEWRGEKVPLFFHDDYTGPVIESDEYGRVIIRFDVLMNAFYHLSLWEENHSTQADHYGRFPASASFLFQQKLLALPLVDYFFDILNAAIEQHYGTLPQARHSFTTVASHDIDLCNSGWRENAFRAAHDKRWLEVARILFKKSFAADEWFNFETILEFEKKAGVRSTWFFLATRRKGRYGVAHADYDLNSAELRPVLQMLKSEGMEIGLHGRLGSAFTDGLLLRDMREFRDKISGNRFHFLAMRSGQSFERIEKSGLIYDASLGFAEQAGFRAATTHPFQPFNFRTQKAHSFYEVPLHIMDTSLIQRSYMGVASSEALNAVLPVIHQVDKFSGVLSVLWHNTSFSGYKYRYWRSVFSQIVSECNSRNSRFSTMSEAIAERRQ